MMLILDAIIAATVAFGVAWLLARHRPSVPVTVRMVLGIGGVSGVVAAVLLATQLLPAGAIVGALAIMLGGMAGRLAAAPRAPN